jgi:hypothetical protein
VARAPASEPDMLALRPFAGADVDVAAVFADVVAVV